MLEINGKKFLNEQEAICYLLNEVQTLKQSLGSALTDPIEGPKGPQGPEGPTGPTGPRGKGFYGCSSVLPSPTGYEEGDFYLLFNGNLYKKVSGNWVLQTNLKGPQGPVGLDKTDDVVANPVAESTEVLNKLEVSGTVYDVLTKAKIENDFVKLENAPQTAYLTEEEKNEIVNGAFVNGSFLGLKNPVFFPADSFSDGDYYQGVVIAPNGAYTIVSTYLIYVNNNNYIEISNNRYMRVQGLEYVNGREFPNYPVSPAKPKVLVAKSNNTLEWQDKPKNLYQHNITITFDDSTYIVFTIICDYDEPIVDISELLEYKYQLEKLPALYFSGQVYDTVVINLPQNGDFSFDVGGGNQTYDYNDDITDITDHFVPLN